MPQAPCFSSSPKPGTTHSRSSRATRCSYSPAATCRAAPRRSDSSGACAARTKTPSWNSPRRPSPRRRRPTRSCWAPSRQRTPPRSSSAATWATPSSCSPRSPRPLGPARPRVARLGQQLLPADPARRVHRRRHHRLVEFTAPLINLPPGTEIFVQAPTISATAPVLLAPATNLVSGLLL